MKSFLQRSVRFLPLIIGLVILAVAAPLMPWDKVWPQLMRLPASTVALLVLCSAVFYLGRIIRYWLMLQMLERPVSFGRVTLACLEAQPVAVLPGGELYRAAMLQRYGGISLKTGASSAFAQSMAEITGLLLIALVGAAILHQYVEVLLGLAAVFGAIIAFNHWPRAHKSHKLLNRLPFINIRPRWLRSFFSKNRILLSPRNFTILLLTSFISTGAGVAIMLISSTALGANLNFHEAAIAYALPTVLEVVSFMPGGIGVHEGGSISILTLFGSSLPLAVALTIIIRIFTLGMGFVYGFGAMLVGRMTGLHQTSLDAA